MKQLIIVLSLAVAAIVGGFPRMAHAAGHVAGNGASAPAGPATATAGAEAQPGTPQRSRMKACNADARTRGLHGAERKAFMKQCLSGGKAKPAAAS